MAAVPVRKKAGVYIVKQIFISFPPAFDFLPHDALRRVSKSLIFFPTKQ